jgi:hypothetical protein
MDKSHELKMDLPTPRLPQDLLEECLLHLAAPELLRCQSVSKGLQYQIEQNSKLQLKLHLFRNGISPPRRPEQTRKYTARDELQRLCSIETRMSKLLYGRQHPLNAMYQLGEFDATNMHLVSVAEGFIFTPLSAPGSFLMRGIARYRLGAFSEPPEILQFERAASHFQIDAAQGVLFVLSMEDDQYVRRLNLVFHPSSLTFRTHSIAPEEDLYRHSLQAYDLQQLAPCNSPMSGLQFFIGRIFQPVSNVSSRWGYLATTSVARKSQSPNLEHFVRLYSPRDSGMLLNVSPSFMSVRLILHVS